jgi:hypothetical protein
MQLVRSTELSGDIEALRESLTEMRLQDLREIARHWNWALRGNAKADIVEQMIGYYTDPTRQKTMLASLSPLQVEVMRWLDVLTTANTAEGLQAAMKIAGGHDLTVGAVQSMLDDLVGAGLVITSEAATPEVPGILLSLLPPVTAPRLVHDGPFEPAEPPMPETIAEAVGALLARIETERPVTTDEAAGGPSLLRGTAQQPGGAVLGPRPGVLPTTTLANWGYRAERQRDQARFFLALLVMGQVCRIDKQSKRLLPDPRQLQTWQDQSPQNQVALLFNWWMQAGPEANDTVQPRVWLSWHELDLGLRYATDYQLRWAGGWTGANELQEVDLLTTRRWLITTLSLLQPDTWYDVNAFSNLIYHMHRDLLRWNPYLAALIWHKDHQRIEAARMDFKTWNASNGAVLRAWLTGPASWLGLVQVGYRSGEPVAFQRPGPRQANEPIELPDDALTYLPDGNILLRNIWQVSSLRPLIQRFAAERKREREVTMYEPDAASFRKTLAEGGSAEQVGEAFRQIGFPLPRAIAAKLDTWQKRAGRHHIYDDVAVIEFTDDMALREVLAATTAEEQGAYVLSPRCLVLTNPDVVPGLLEELARKGYSPRLVQAEQTRSARQ